MFPTVSVFGVPDPFEMPAALRTKAEAGGIPGPLGGNALHRPDRPSRQSSAGRRQDEHDQHRRYHR